LKYISSAFNLRAGKAYYIEALYQAGEGNDVIKVAARLAGTGFPTPADSPIGEIDANSMYGASIGFPLAPRDLGGPLTIVEDLADVTAQENHAAIFSVACPTRSISQCCMNGLGTAS
jgi:hypothetical protein